MINLSRFSVFFPERRPFFLENAGLFTVGNDYVQPFISRSIGLGENGNLIPINAGLRYTNRTAKQSIGAILVHQGRENSPKTLFSVGRYAYNYGEQNNIGAMMTLRTDEGNDNLIKGSNRATVSINGFNRYNQALSSEFMLSYNHNNQGRPSGMSGNAYIGYNTNRAYIGTYTTFITQSYNSGVGFTGGNNLIVHNPYAYAKIRAKWLPKWIRQIDPGFGLTIFQAADDFKLQEVSLDIFPAYVILSDGSLFSYHFKPSFENLAFDFSPIGIDVKKGKYNYVRHRMTYKTDQSKKWSMDLVGSVGGYYNGQLNSFQIGTRYAPIPHIAIGGSYEYNHITELGENKENATAHLFSTDIRLALNPRVQLIGFYQYNSETKRGRFNGRFSWEYKPLSYVFVVFNSSNDSSGIEQQFITKVNFVRQF